ncbi:S-adenosyl-L-methionine-dependent methyltransferase [Poronia punctata]|nr:S-adenosyl-L-methionine-dependent methyltransferase [Poronia punctata]
MATNQEVKKLYGENAPEYEKMYQPTNLLLRLENELFAAAFKHPTVKEGVVLDLGGGTGLKARMALDAGAAAVDVVDLSAEMMSQGQVIEAELDRHAVRWFEADISQPLTHLSLRPQYDVVMANWVFDHVDNIETLEGMWRNIATYLKPGGLFLGVRNANIGASYQSKNDYGFVAKDIEEIPGGIKYRVYFSSSPVVLDGASMEVMYSGSTALYEKHGLVDVHNLPVEDTDVVKENPDLFQPFIEEPALVVVQATKKL